MIEPQTLPMFSHVDTLIHAIHRAARQARTLPPPPHFPVPWEPCVLSEGAPRPPFAYESLESLWDPNLRRSAIGRLGMGVPLPLPRATYEQDDEHWVRVPLPSDGVQRGILQLACLVHDSSLHVYDDFSKVAHTNRFAARVDEELTRQRSLQRRLRGTAQQGNILSMDCTAMLGDPLALTSIARATGVDLLLDESSDAPASLVACTRGSPPTAPCAWLVCDRETDTWAVRVFQKHSLAEGRHVVQGAAFLRAVRLGSWEQDCSYTTLKAACCRAAIRLPRHCDRAGLVAHIKATCGLPAGSALGHS